MRWPCCRCDLNPPTLRINFRMRGPIFTEPEPVSTAYFVTSSHHSVLLCLPLLSLLGNSIVGTLPLQRIHAFFFFNFPIYFQSVPLYSANVVKSYTKAHYKLHLGPIDRAGRWIMSRIVIVTLIYHRYRLTDSINLLGSWRRRNVFPVRYGQCYRVELSFKQKSEVTLRLTVGHSVSMSWRRAHLGTCDQRQDDG
jgi:hypothetical protein